MQIAIKIAINLVAAYACVYWASDLFGLRFDENERQYWPGRLAARWRQRLRWRRATGHCRCLDNSRLNLMARRRCNFDAQAVVKCLQDGKPVSHLKTWLISVNYWTVKVFFNRL